MGNDITTSAVVAFALIECLKDHGLTSGQIKAETGLNETDYSGLDIKIKVRQLIRLWEMAVDVTGDPALTIHLRQTYGKNLTHFINCIAMNSANGLEALKHWSRYASLVCEANRVVVTEANDCATITFINTVPEISNPWIPEHTFYQLIDYARILIGDEFEPVDIRFQHLCPCDPRIYEEFFRCPVYFLQEENSVCCRRELLLKDFKESNPHLQSVLIERAESDLKQLTKSSSFKSRVIECVVEEMPKGSLSVESICKNLNMSRSTLHRKLKEEATSFNFILVDVRMELAKTYLNQDMNVTQIAYLLGYSNASNFLNAFKRWFGVNPGKYRDTFLKS